MTEAKVQNFHFMLLFVVSVCFVFIVVVFIVLRASCGLSAASESPRRNYNINDHKL